MPIYEYVCKDCRKEFEMLLRGGEKPFCPGCQGFNLEKKFSAFAVGGATPEGCDNCQATDGPCGPCSTPEGRAHCRFNN